ncbi:membrane protein [Streptomyces rubellomurinus subsp. indigoferus]|uniref:Membrane protein n=1 Tax=Streptomyces rubellomurinus (strain ATCC 31215) TaxID=359131 RepID=A0A0F2TCN7_STRR3|nr:DUF881 domain-containing protein [Streptomyces rubellomurinus]KJS56581.1 membrane protein [Streptomyces rubellomurinus subsp. indigoferus]KJS60953.1 membrane protein [Streptomyces rubellomurinus]
MAAEPAEAESAPADTSAEEAVETAAEGADGPEESAESDAAPARAPEAEPEPVVSEPAAGAEHEAGPDEASAPDRAPEAAPEPEPEPEPEPAPVDGNAGRRRLKAALWPPRLSRGQLVVALLLFSLGLALAIQVRSTNDHHSQLRGARQEDLVRILDELDSRQQRLQQEKAELEQSLAKLENSSNQAKEAQEQTRKKATELGVLAGTVKATGPGIVLTVDDPQGLVKADMLLDTLQELRAAGAEAIQINDVRVVVNTYFTDLSGGGVQIDGKKASAPYRFTVVGNPQDLVPALNIPGGVVRTLESHQARATITQQQKVVVDAVVDLKTPQYAKPASK